MHLGYGPICNNLGIPIVHLYRVVSMTKVSEEDKDIIVSKVIKKEGSDIQKNLARNKETGQNHCRRHDFLRNYADIRLTDIDIF